MNANLKAGYREIEHTADWALEVWAPDLPGLLEQAARGMYALSGLHLAEGPLEKHSLTLQAADAESLLVRFLSELLFIIEQEELGFCRFDLQVEGDTLLARLEGAPVISLEKEIKAVTYHNLSIHKSPAGLSVRIVFDV